MRMKRAVYETFIVACLYVTGNSLLEIFVFFHRPPPLGSYPSRESSPVENRGIGRTQSYSKIPLPPFSHSYSKNRVLHGFYACHVSVDEPSPLPSPPSHLHPSPSPSPPLPSLPPSPHPGRATSPSSDLCPLPPRQPAHPPGRQDHLVPAEQGYGRKRSISSNASEDGYDGDSEKYGICFACTHMHIHVHSDCLRRSDCLGCAVLLCLVCLFDLACFFLSSFSSLIKKNMYTYMYMLRSVHIVYNIVTFVPLSPSCISQSPSPSPLHIFDMGLE